MIEIEAKAPISQPEPLRILLEQRFGVGELLHKEDTYYCHSQYEDIRIRRNMVTSVADKESPLEQAGVLTMKVKTLSRGLECNHEVELGIDSVERGEALLELLGYTAYIHKKKLGYRWESGPLVYELMEVVGLGWFLEIEAVIPESESEHDLESTDTSILGEEQAGRLVVNAFADLGISEDQFEERYYTDILGELQG